MNSTFAPSGAICRNIFSLGSAEVVGITFLTDDLVNKLGIKNGLSKTR